MVFLLSLTKQTSGIELCLLSQSKKVHKNTPFPEILTMLPDIVELAGERGGCPQYRVCKAPTPTYKKQTWQLKTTDFILSLFWRPEV